MAGRAGEVARGEPAEEVRDEIEKIREECGTTQESLIGQGGTVQKSDGRGESRLRGQHLINGCFQHIPHETDPFNGLTR